MERKGLIAGAVALAAIVLVVVLVVSSGGGEPAEDPARIGSDERTAAGPESGPSHTPGEAPRPDAERRPSGAIARRVTGDGGVLGPAAERSGASTRGQLRPDPLDAERSAGWRLGRARARITLVETRVARLREALAELERGGDTDSIERQRRILSRFETRLAQLREEETRLEAEATQDGTLGDVAQGMREGVDPNEARRPPIRMGL